MSEKSILKHGNWLKLNDVKAARAKTMYEDGMSIEEVASHFGVTRQSMYGTLKRMGTVFRSRYRYREENHFYRGGQSAVDSSQNKLENALRRGQATRPERCQMCGKKPKPFKNGRTGIQAHHEDYSEPLEVMWLCQPCHHKRHREISSVA